MKEKKSIKRYRHKLSYGCQEKLEGFYKKWKKECIFGKYPKEMAFDTILYQSMQYMGAMIPMKIKRERQELKLFEKEFEKYKKSKKYKEDMKWMRNRERIELPSNRRKKNAGR